MCLSRITESYDLPCPMITDGWKQFSGTEAKPRFSSYTVNGQSDVPLDKWIIASQDRAPSGVRASDGNMYEAGFHVYANEPKSTKGYRRVFVRNITCRGEDGQETIIAREMYVPSDPNGWPPKGDEPGSGGGGKKSRPNPVKKFIEKTIDDMKAKGVTPGQA